MNLVNDYFLLYHGVHYDNDTVLTLKTLDEELFYEVSALILVSNRKSLPRFLCLESFTTLVSKINDSSLHELDALYTLQYSLIQTILKDSSSEKMHKLHQAFDFLKDEKILSIEHHEKLISLFDPKGFHSFENEEIDAVTKEKDFFEQKDELQELLIDLKALGENSSYQETLSEIEQYMNKQTFSVGITGVMNAGKSTLLNALMGEEVLGSSVVPETANLSLIKYALKPYAKVFYWSKAQWEQIVYTALEIEAISDFVQESEAAFKNEFHNYIQEEARVDEIPIADLHQYTSAKHKKSNLIKEIELGVNLDFLSDGIEIVDTPGLDDVIIQREEITKDYLNKCDLMIHLMNVSQSATQKDISFIIDALLYQNIGKLLIVLTRSDSVNSSELDEVIKYTKKSIKTQLQARNADSKLDFILSSLEFIAVSSKMALLHKTGQTERALEEGYTLERSGILDIESYLYKTLYGQGSYKSELIINSAKSRILKVVQAQISYLQYELRLLSKNEDELEKEIEVVNLTKSENSKLIKQMKDEIKSYKGESMHFANGLEIFLEAQVFSIRQRLSSRLIDDFVYAVQKKNKKEFMSGLDMVLDLALKDGLIDIIREYRYKFIQKSESIAKKIEFQYESHDIKVGQSAEALGVLEMINEHFKGGLIHASSVLLTSKLKRLFLSSTVQELSALQVDLDQVLQESFDNVLKGIKSKLETINEVLIQELFQNLSIPLERFEEKLDNESHLLSQSLVNYEKDEKKRAAYSIQIHKQLKALMAANLRCRL